MQDKITYNKKFEFNSEVSTCFEDMLKRSIPNYDFFRSLTDSICNMHLFGKEDTNILDIGSSTGLSIDGLINNTNACFDLVEPSIDMCKVLKNKYDNNENINIINSSIEDINPDKYFDICICVFTLQFTPVETRMHIIDKIYNMLKSDGILIIAEKELSTDVNEEIFLTETYYSIKEDNNYTQEQIQSKRNALKNVLIPLSSDMNVEILKNAGFRLVSNYWKSLQFSSYMCLK